MENSGLSKKERKRILKKLSRMDGYEVEEEEDIRLYIYGKVILCSCAKTARL